MHHLQIPKLLPNVIRLFALTAVLLAALLLSSGTGRADEPAHSASGFLYVKTIDQVLCQTAYTGGFIATYYTRGECTRIEFNVTNAGASNMVTVTFIDPGSGNPFTTLNASHISGNLFRIVFQPDASWPAGHLTLQVTVQGDSAPAGAGTYFLNALGATVSAEPKPDGSRYAPGETIPLTGAIYQLNDIAANTQKNGVPAQFSLQVRTPDGELRGPYGPYTAAGDGSFPTGIELPSAATAGLTAGPETGFQVTVGVDVIDASFTDPISGAWAANHAASGAVTLMVPPDQLILENSFVSSVGWVKPGETYPFRVFVKNFMEQAAANAVVTIPAPPSVSFEQVTTLNSSGTAVINGDGSITWSVGSLPAANNGNATVATLVVQARAAGLDEDPEVVWKDLSSIAVLTYDGGPAGLASESHGPKVIPPHGSFESARYGDKPFPMVPVDYTDRKHEAGHSGEALARVVNSPDVPGSTFNLYQEMSYGQLYPFGHVPSAGIASAGFEYEHGFNFTSPSVTGTCRGTTLGPLEPAWGTPLYPERIRDGWYQMPGDTEYYGGDFPAFTLGVGSSIDSACGPIGKAVYDAAVIADPEIDYNQFDSDKDGVVDFFMMVFVGLGGNGASQIQGLPPYDNIWPHSSSLEHYYQDENGLAGYVSDDQLTNLEGTPQCWVNDNYDIFDDCAQYGGSGQDDLPTFVRVGPYNVNPESAIDAASVISHEYGHHLGLPDYYAGYSAYNDWNLMAADYSQHMTIFSKQELGWVVPNFLQPGEQVTVENWAEIKNDTGEITWQRPDGSFYTLSAANGDQNIHNGQAFGLKLPGRLVIDPDLVAEQASAPYVWYSGRGNQFGCAPAAGHNLDITLPELADLPAGSDVRLSFKSSWDIEWDWDYGFVMVTTDGSNYSSLPSEMGYTTDNVYNPNNSGCMATHNNGITGQSGAYAGGPAVVTAARNPAANDYSNGAPFLTDEYDLSTYAGQENVVLRFSYFTDPAFDRPGWFMDDIEVTVDGSVIYSSDFTEEDELRIFPGGCGDEGMKVAATCTAGWSRIKTDATSELDHAYYLELRDRSGFDFNGRGQSDRGDIGWAPGVLIEYTDEVRGYGNNGGSMPPNQHYLDSQPEPGLDCGDNLVEENPPGVLTDPRCQDAAFTAATGDNQFSDNGWIDNFVDPSSPDGLWHFDYGCLTLDVLAMSGHTGNSEALPSDLTATVTISAGAGCVTYDYGRDGAAENTPPTAVAQARPTNPAVGQNVVFDGSGSFDAQTPADQLSYAWDFDGDGVDDASGQTVNHSYATAGTYQARLTVTDEGGLSDEDIVEITVSGDPQPGTGGHVSGAGWLATDEGEKININFRARDIDGTLEGELKLRDRVVDVKIQLDTVTEIGPVSGNCGQSITAASANAIEFQGTGNYNGTAATFRVCAQDNGQPGQAADNFYLECSAGCTYNTGARTPDDTIDGGNIKLHSAPESGSNGDGSGSSTTGGQGTSSSTSSSVLMLDPLLLSEAQLGALQPLTVIAYDDSGELLAGVDLTLQQTLADGTTQMVTAVTGLDGLATFTITILNGEAEFIAYDGDLTSNAVNIVGLGGLLP